MTITTFAKDRLQHLQNSSNSPLDEYEVTEERSYFTQGPEYVVIKVHPHTQTSSIQGGRGVGGELKREIHGDCASYSRATCTCSSVPFPHHLPLSTPALFSIPTSALTSVLTSLPVSLFPVSTPLPVPISLLPPICLFPSPLSQIDHAVVASLFTDSRGHETLAASHRQLRGFLIDVDGDVLKELSPEPGKPDKVGSSAIVLQTTDAWALTMTYQCSDMLPFLPH